MPSLLNFSYWHTCGSGIGIEKLKFYYNYFYSQSISNEEERFVLFERKSMPAEEYKNLESSLWDSSDKTLAKLNIHSEGTIEDGTNTLMVDFANEYIGGGCMGLAAVQEEILFLIFPELLFCLMQFQIMDKHDNIVVKGVKRYSKYTGYAMGLKFDGLFDDEECTLGEDKVLKRTFTCIDSLYLADYQDQHFQFYKEKILREINKAYIGFQGSSEEQEQENKLAVSTGNWGCGAFAGNIELKFLIQWMAASVNGRDVEYYTFKDKNCKYLEDIHKICSNMKVGEVFKELIHHSQFLQAQIDTDYSQDANGKINFTKGPKKFLLSSYLKSKYSV
mmetsp:Transcript_7763/g.6862  ORF Transcript_7763/g.6862 Transcript_7763/m.6862 type:complete len:333 (+) Transcript_7763:426-1424(+)